MKEKIIIGSDHAGYELKKKLKKLLSELGYQFEDTGSHDAQSVDYPNTAFKVAKKVALDNVRGILVCGTGLGEAIVANKVKGVRATNCFNEYTAIKSREHNNSNLLCLGARVLSAEEAEKIAKLWLTTQFSNEERHKRRVKLIGDIEKKICK